jgi:hypothetical protein
MILETKPAWGTVSGMFRNAHAPKMLRATGAIEAHEWLLERIR